MGYRQEDRFLALTDRAAKRTLAVGRHALPASNRRRERAAAKSAGRFPHDVRQGDRCAADGPRVLPNEPMAAWLSGEADVYRWLQGAAGSAVCQSDSRHFAESAGGSGT